MPFLISLAQARTVWAECSPLPCKLGVGPPKTVAASGTLDSWAHCELGCLQLFRLWTPGCFERQSVE